MCFSFRVTERDTLLKKLQNWKFYLKTAFCLIEKKLAWKDPSSWSCILFLSTLLSLLLINNLNILRWPITTTIFLHTMLNYRARNVFVQSKPSYVQLYKQQLPPFNQINVLSFFWSKTIFNSIYSLPCG